jgi:adenosylhomocysteine nucleosidase
MKAVRDVAKELRLQHKRCRSTHGDYVDLGRIGPSRVLAVETHMGPFASTGSAAKALQWLAATQAQAVIGVGMAFGARPKSQKLGDVMVCTSLLPYDYRIVRCPSRSGEGSEARRQPTHDYSSVEVYRARPQLQSLFERAASLPRWRDRVHLGAFLSGAARIHCAAYRDELVQAFLDRGLVIGGDMEGVGLLASSDALDSRWIMVKAISDFADAERDAVIKETRPQACYNSAQFVLSTLMDEESLRAQP